MPKLEIELTDDLAEQLRPYQDRVREILVLGLQQMRMGQALLRYEQGVVSFARASELAGVPEDALIRHARSAGIEPRWSEAMVSEELA